jgi:hypothetical protein
MKTAPARFCKERLARKKGSAGLSCRAALPDVEGRVPLGRQGQPAWSLPQAISLRRGVDRSARPCAKLRGADPPLDSDHPAPAGPVSAPRGAWDFGSAAALPDAPCPARLRKGTGRLAPLPGHPGRPRRVPGATAAGGGVAGSSPYFHYGTQRCLVRLASWLSDLGANTGVYP